jgi:glyoxylase-like metal-dependent hydrolase (beta-lactamase superfamily II)
VTAANTHGLLEDRAIATPGHAPTHHAYTVGDRRRGTEEPWLVFSGDSLVIGDVGGPDLHVAGDARGVAGCDAAGRAVTYRDLRWGSIFMNCVEATRSWRPGS